MKQFLIAALFLAAAGTAVASPQGPRPDEAPRGARAEAPSAERFAEHKQRLLERMTQHGQMLAKARECVQAAKTPQDLRECRPVGERKGRDSHDRQDRRAHGMNGEPHGEAHAQGDHGGRPLHGPGPN